MPGRVDGWGVYGEGEGMKLDQRLEDCREYGDDVLASLRSVFENSPFGTRELVEMTYEQVQDNIDKAVAMADKDNLAPIVAALANVGFWKLVDSIKDEGGQP